MARRKNGKSWKLKYVSNLDGGPISEAYAFSTEKSYAMIERDEQQRHEHCVVKLMRAKAKLLEDEF